MLKSHLEKCEKRLSKILSHGNEYTIKIAGFLCGTETQYVFSFVRTSSQTSRLESFGGPLLAPRTALDKALSSTLSSSVRKQLHIGVKVSPN